MTEELIKLPPTDHEILLNVLERVKLQEEINDRVTKCLEMMQNTICTMAIILTDTDKKKAEVLDWVK